MSKPSATLKNDQWFKFYYLRILVSCNGWKDDEFGAYIKLLIHQFDKGFIPNDEKKIKKIITSHKKNWDLLKQKFPEIEPGKLMNDVMKIVRDEFDEKKTKGKEWGKTGGRPKKENPTLSKKEPEGFQNERDNISSSYSNSNSLEKEESVKEEKTKNETLIIPSMLTCWKMNNPKAFIRLTNDSEQLFEIAKKIMEWMSLTGDVATEENAEKIKQKWQEICEFLSKDDFLKKYSLAQVNNHLASVIQSFNNRNNGSKQSNSNGSATSRSVEALLSDTNE